MKGFSQLLLKLHQGCREAEPGYFRSWALNELRDIVPFDTAFWASAKFDKVSGNAQIHSDHVEGLPSSFGQDYGAVAHLDPLLQRVRTLPDCCIAHSVSPRADCQTGFGVFAHRHRLNHSISMLMMDLVTRLDSWITLYRAESAPAFSETEQVLYEQIVPHLIETWRANRLEHVHRLCQADARTVFSAAIVDRQLMLHPADDRFTSLLHMEWADWNGPAPPRPLRDLATGQSSDVFVGSAILASACALSDMRVLRVRAKNGRDRLGTREREVAGLYASGHSYKRIAQELGLSPSTVSNQLSTIYDKLKISSKAQLASLLASSERG